MVGLHQVGDPALTGLRIDPDHGLIASSNILRVNWKIGNGPGVIVNGVASSFSISLEVLKALLDGVLVATRERCVDKITAVGRPLRHRQLVAVFDGSLDFVNVTEVDHRINALVKQV